MLLNLGVGMILALFLSWHFRRYGSTLSNREEFSQVFPFILLTTVLVISVVKSSLALSLGLVGALSIVRFRTPIKEPEELAYLFLAIAMGLGLGANQTLVTVTVGPGILVLISILKSRPSRLASKTLHLMLTIGLTAEHTPEGVVHSLNEIVGGCVASADLRRVDIHGESAEVLYILGLGDVEAVTTLISRLRAAFPGIDITFIDQSRLPEV